jgi:uncharacterized protein (TIGR03437 family)
VRALCISQLILITTIASGLEPSGNLSRPPLAFEPDCSQPSTNARFVSRGHNQALLLDRQGMQFRFLDGGTITLALADSNPYPITSAEGELPGRSNIFVGNNRSRWCRSVRTYRQVRYKDLYPGIDMVVYGSEGRLEYDLIVGPGADVSRVRLLLRGARDVAATASGDLHATTLGGSLTMKQPLVYQEQNGRRESIVGRYALNESGEISFEIGPYDRARPLVIDPVLMYATYLGGRGDEGATSMSEARFADIAVDKDGNTYLITTTTSTDFPVRGPIQPNANSGLDAVITKLSADGSSVIYSTYLGGRGIDRGFGIAVDENGAAYVTGRTQSTDFPTVNPLKRSLGGDEDAFIAKLDPTGSQLLFSTYLGGTHRDDGISIALDSLGNVVATGETQSSDFPIVNGPQPVFGGRYDVWVAKVDTRGAGILYSTYVGGSAGDDPESLSLDSAGNIYIAGNTASVNFPTRNAVQPSYGGGAMDAFVFKINANGGIAYATFLGGTRRDAANGVSVSASGDAFVTGITESTTFPVSGKPLHDKPIGQIDAFVLKLTPSGGLAYSTYVGGTGHDYGYSVAVDEDGNAWITGTTDSPDFPVTANRIQDNHKGSFDAFLMQINSSGSELMFSTLLGSNTLEVAGPVRLDGAGYIYIAGLTDSSRFPVTPGSFSTAFSGGRTDVFVAKLSNRSPARCVSAASFSSLSRVAPNSIAAIFGTGLAPRLEVATANPPPIELAGVEIRVTVGEVTRSAPLFFVSPGQINFLVPEVPTGTAQVKVIARSAGTERTVAEGAVEIWPYMPALFTANSDGRGVPAAIGLRAAADGTQTPVAVMRCGNTAGSCVPEPIDLGPEGDQVVLVLFGTGIRAASEVVVSAADVLLPVLYAGVQPEYPGLDQVNVRLPRSLIGRGELAVVVTANRVIANSVVIHVK